MVWGVLSDCLFLSIDSVSGVLSGVPGQSDVGSFWVNVSVVDGFGGLDWSNFSLVVSNVNDDPLISSFDVTSAVEGVLYSSDYDAVDSDGDVLVWGVLSDCLFLSIDSVSGVLSGVPGQSDVGSFWVNVSVVDGFGGLDWSNFTLIVIEFNNEPIVDIISNQGINEGSSFNNIILDDYVDDVEDADEDISWTISGNFELSITIIDRIATITTPNNNWFGQEIVTFTATDSGGLSDFTSVTFSVTAVNDPPVVSDIPYQDINEGNSFSNIILDNYVNDEIGRAHV